MELYPSKKFNLHLYNLNVPGTVEENLVSKAFRMLKSQFPLPEIQVHLLKNIPAGSGLGGGSADAAKFLSGINQYFNLR